MPCAAQAAIFLRSSGTQDPQLVPHLSCLCSSSRVRRVARSASISDSATSKQLQSVRPRDIATDNTISYDKIAEARISYGGRGRMTEIQQPGWGHQIIDLILPF